MSNDKDDALVGALAALAATGVSCSVSLSFHFTPPEPEPLAPAPETSGYAAGEDFRPMGAFRPGRIRLDWSAGRLEVATVNLAQGIASGMLRGDELRSLLENSPALAHALCRGFARIDEFKLPQGRLIGPDHLRTWGEEGRLTPPVVVRALVEALVEADDPTLARNAGSGRPFSGKTECLLSPAAEETLACLFLRGPTMDGDVPSKAGRTELVQIGLVDRGQGLNWLTSDGVGEAVKRGLHVRKETMDRRQAAPAAEPARAEYEVPKIRLYLYADEGICVGGARNAVFGVTTQPEDLYANEGRWFIGVHDAPLPSGWAE